jgi:hypothetical protein
VSNTRSVKEVNGAAESQPQPAYGSSGEHGDALQSESGSAAAAPALHRFPGAVPRRPRVAAALPFLRASAEWSTGTCSADALQLRWSPRPSSISHRAATLVRAPAPPASFGASSNPSSFKVFLFVILLVVSGPHACTKKASKIDAFVICMQLM